MLWIGLLNCRTRVSVFSSCSQSKIDNDLAACTSNIPIINLIENDYMTGLPLHCLIPPDIGHITSGIPYAFFMIQWR